MNHTIIRPKTKMSCASERLHQCGIEHLSNIELCAIIYGTGFKEHNAQVLATETLRCVGGLKQLVTVSPQELQQIVGVGPQKATRLMAAVELGRRTMTCKLDRKARITSSQAVDAAMRARLQHSEVERFFTIAVDARNRPIAEFEIARGGLSVCPVAPADVFRPLIRVGASGTIFVHNHPSGDPSPSSDDVLLTGHLEQTGRLLGIRTLDHVIIGDEGYFSFVDAGLMEPVNGSDTRAPTKRAL